MRDKFENDLKEIVKQREQVLAQLHALTGIIQYLEGQLKALDTDSAQTVSENRTGDV